MRLSEGKTVNQTEFDSLKLNTTEPSQQQKQNLTFASLTQQQQFDASRTKAEQQHANLASMLIPDLSDNSKLSSEFAEDEIPEESSEKFLDFLSKNHEKLAAATSEQQQLSTLNAETQTTTTQSTPTTTISQQTNTGLNDNQQEGDDEEATIEIQIKTIASNITVDGDNNNNNNNKDNDDDKVDENQQIVTSTTQAPQLVNNPTQIRTSFNQDVEQNQHTILEKLIRSSALID